MDVSFVSESKDKICLSIDVGIRNLAFCKMTGSKIMNWNVIDLYDIIESYDPAWVACVYKHWKKDKLVKCIKSWNMMPEKKMTCLMAKTIISKRTRGMPKTIGIDILAKLLIIFWDNNSHIFNDCDYIYIENQPSLKNPHMKTIQIILLTYFIMRGMKNVQFVHAGLKLKYSQKQNWIPPGKCSYRAGKLHAVKITREHILPIQGGAMTDFFENNTKKDDLADCALQALASINQISSVSSESSSLLPSSLELKVLSECFTNGCNSNKDSLNEFN
tara:strand:- start:349 stop:1170 length:822 start_codon:yes stop_codon:yes gene_type:complete